MEMLIDVFTDAAIDCIKMLPFLFLAFLLIEALEHYSSDFTKKLMIKVDKAGPVVGAVVGCVPQCGFSVMAANLLLYFWQHRTKQFLLLWEIRSMPARLVYCFWRK